MLVSHAYLIKETGMASHNGVVCGTEATQSLKKKIVAV